MPRVPISKTNAQNAPHKCSHCPKSFKNRSELKRHENTHLEDKPHECPMCDMKFAQKGQLKNHVNTHTGQKPEICKFCGRAFNDTACKSRHEREQHSDFAGFKCVLCGYMVKRRSNFLDHMASHGVSKSSVDPWQNAYTVDGSKIDPTRNLQKQLKWEHLTGKFYINDPEDFGPARRTKTKKAAATLVKGRTASSKETADDKKNVVLLKPRASRKRRSDEVEEDEEDGEDDDDNDDEEYKPTSRARPVKRLRTSAPVSAPVAVPVEETFTDLYTISPASDLSPEPEWTSSSFTTPVIQTSGSQPSFEMSAYGVIPTHAEATALYFSQDALGLTHPSDTPSYLGYSSNFPVLSTGSCQTSSAVDEFNLYLGQGESYALSEYDDYIPGASFDGPIGFKNGDYSQPVPPQLSFDDCHALYFDASALGGHTYYETHATSGDFLSASSPRAPSSQGSSRCPSPLGLVPANNEFSVPSISSLGRARASAQLMPRIRQEVSYFDGYASSI